MNGARVPGDGALEAAAERALDRLTTENLRGFVRGTRPADAAAAAREVARRLESQIQHDSAVLAHLLSMLPPEPPR